MKDKLNTINVRLADLPPIAMTDVTVAEEEIIRQAEYNINRLWRSWRPQFKDKSAAEVLAMITLRFAELYYDHLRQMETLKGTFDDFEASLDKALIDTGTSDRLTPES
ncbi:MAG: cell division protein ZapA [Bacteroidales bacterium]|nr:cell division protein ZapA [Bacteroidales bacterium]